MIKEKIGGHIVELYESIDELPMDRHHKFGKYMLIDAGIGSDINDINNRSARISDLIDADPASAKLELENLRRSLYLVANELNAKHMALVPWIHSVDGKKVTDLTDEGVKKVLAKLSTAKTGLLHRLMESMKKKIEEELKMYFPSRFNSLQQAAYYNGLYDIAMLEADRILEGRDVDDRIKEIENHLLLLAKPMIFFGEQNAEILHDKNYMDMKLAIEKELHVSTKDMTVLEFYNAADNLIKLEKQLKKKKNGR